MVSVDNNDYYQVVVDNLNLCVVLCIKLKHQLKCSVVQNSV